MKLPLIAIRSGLSEIRYEYSKLSQNWLIGFVNKFVFVFYSISFILLIARYRMLPPQVPFWYTKPWGIDQLADSAWLFLLPLGSLTLFLINIIISVKLTKNDLIFAQITAIVSLLVGFLSFITLMKIIFLVS